MKITWTASKDVRLALSLLLCAVPSYAQLAGPISGVVFEEGSRSLHQILGMPGGATLGAAIALPHGLRHAVVSSQRSFALGLIDDDSQAVVLITGLLSSEPTSVALEGVEGGPSQMVFSADGGSALLLYGEQRRLRLLRGLPGAPNISSALELPGAVAGSSMAVSNDGKRVLVAQQPADGLAALQFLLASDDGAAGEWRTVAWLEHPGPVTFLRTDTSAAVADGRRVWLFDNLDSDVRVAALASEEHGIGTVTGLGETRTNRGLIVTDADSGQITLMSVDEPWRREAIAAPGGATQCTALQPGGPFLVGKLGQAPLYLLDLDPVPGVFFVPRGLELQQ
jgi:hypothetical protein